MGAVTIEKASTERPTYSFNKEALKTVSRVEMRFYVRCSQHILKSWIFRVRLRRTWEAAFCLHFRAGKLKPREGDWVSCFAELRGVRTRCCISRGSGSVTRLHCFLFRPFHPEESNPTFKSGVDIGVYKRALRHPALVEGNLLWCQTAAFEYWLCPFLWTLGEVTFLITPQFSCLCNAETYLEMCSKWTGVKDARVWHEAVEGQGLLLVH